MKSFVLLSDLHAHPWSAFARGDGANNSRLLRSVEVLRDSLHRAAELDVPWVFAGDLVHTAGYALNEVLALLTSAFEPYGDVPKVAVWGNHDARGKGGRITLEQTVWAALLRGIPDLTILEDGIPREVGDIIFAGAGYQPSMDFLPQDSPGLYADVGVYHQTVRGSRSPTGFELPEGVPAEWLQERHRISVVGHVHHPQRFGSVLVPGSPEHHNFGDRGWHGWYQIQLHPTGSFDVEEVPGGSPEFRTVETPAEVQDDGHFYRVRSARDPDALPGNATYLAPEPTTVGERDVLRDASQPEEILQAWLREDPPEDPEGYLAVGLALLRAQDPKRPRPVRVEWLRLKNFGSYAEEELPVRPGLWLVVGKGRDYPSNGAGKSTLSGEALYWLLHGRTTKGQAADEVIRWGAGSCSVEGRFKDQTTGEVFHVERTRGPSGPTLAVTPEDGEPWEAASVTDMTAKLGAYLGLTPEIHQHLGYYSQEKLLLFASATDGERKGVLADLVGLEAYQEAASAAGEQARVHERTRDGLAHRLEAQEESLAAANARLKVRQQEETEAETRHAEEVATLEAALEEARNGPPTGRDRLDGIRRRGEALVSRRRATIATYEEMLADSHLHHLTAGDAEGAAELRREIQEAEDALAPYRGEEPARGIAGNLPARQARAEDTAASVASLTTDLNEARAQHASAQATLTAAVKRAEEVEAERLETERDLSYGTCPVCGQSLPEEARQEQLRALSAKQAVANRARQDAARTVEETAAAVASLFDDVQAAQQREAALDHLVTAGRDAAEKLRRLDRAREALVAHSRSRERLRETAARLAAEEIQRDGDAYAAHVARWVARAERVVKDREAAVCRRVAEVETALANAQAWENPHTGHVTEAKAEVTQLTSAVSATQDQVRNLRAQIAVHTYWQKAFGRQGIQSLLLEEVASAFNRARGTIFPLLTQGVYDVQFSTLSHTRAGELRERTDFAVTHHGNPVPYATLSGGQRRRVDVGILLTLAIAISEWMGVEGILGTLVLDEVFGFLDEAGAEGLLDALSQVQERIPVVYVVTHDTHLQSLFPAVLRVEQDEDGISRITEGASA